MLHKTDRRTFVKSALAAPAAMALSMQASGQDPAAPAPQQAAPIAALPQGKIIVEKHPDGHAAYPVGLKGILVAEGDTCIVSRRFRAPVSKRCLTGDSRKMASWQVHSRSLDTSGMRLYDR